MQTPNIRLNQEKLQNKRLSQFTPTHARNLNPLRSQVGKKISQVSIEKYEQLRQISNLDKNAERLHLHQEQPSIERKFGSVLVLRDQIGAKRSAEFKSSK